MTASCISSWGGGQDSKGVRRGGGGYFPLYCTVTSLSSDAVCVVLFFEKLSIAVALNIPRDSSEELSTVCRGPLRSNVSRISICTFILRTDFQAAVQEICLARMLKVLAVVRPLVLYVRVMETESVEVVPNSAYT